MLFAMSELCANDGVVQACDVPVVKAALSGPEILGVDKKAPGIARGFDGLADLAKSVLSSILRDHRAAELVVHADGDEIDVLTDAIGTDEGAGRRGEAQGAILHEHVIVFHRGRPVRSEAVF